MLTHGSILVSILWLVEQIPTPSPSAKRQRGRQETYSDKLFVKALIVMIIRRLYTAYALLHFLEQDDPVARQIRPLLTGSVSKVEIDCDGCHTGPGVASFPKPGVAHDLYRGPMSPLSERADRQTRQDSPGHPALSMPKYTVCREELSAELPLPRLFTRDKATNH